MSVIGSISTASLGLARPLPSRRGLFPESAWWFASLLALAVVAFWPTYFGLLGKVPLSVALHLHAGAMFVWMALLIAQAMLARRRDRSWHRRLGKVSYLAAPVAAASMLVLAIANLRAAAPSVQPDRSYLLFVQVALLAMFFGSWLLAMLHRRQPAIHARYMIGTALPLIDPALARLLFARLPQFPLLAEYGGGAVTLAILATLITLERNASAGRGVFPRLFAAFLLIQLLQSTLAKSAWWHALVSDLALRL